MKKLFIQFLLALVFCFSFVFSGLEKRIIGGEEAPPDKYRWAVSIKGNVDALKRSGACGASILKTEGQIYWLLTAAHCFFPSDGINVYNLTKGKYWHARVGLMKVDFLYKKHGIKDKVKEKVKSFFNKAYRKLFGKNKFKVTTDDLHISKIIIHPRYQPTGYPVASSLFRMDNDIALMKLKEPLPVSQLAGISTIELPDSSANTTWPTVGSECIVVGWGCIKVRDSPNPVAKLAKLQIWENSECEKSIPTKLYLNPLSDFCAGYLKKQYGLCHGDSGSGLICDYQGKQIIAGVVSRGHGGDPGEYPGVFTRVSAFRNWIDNVVASN